LVLVNILSRYFSVFIILENQYRIGDVVNWQTGVDRSEKNL
jgi:small-conductance mechanosensitive channel